MGYLVLENGKYFKGKLIGSKKSTIGEVVFNTGMTGYEQIITDPSYYGQIVVMTYPLIGNYGINIEDIESSIPQVKALVVRELCDLPSNWRSEKSLDEFLIENDITGLQGIDTRDLTKAILASGSQKGIICKELPCAEELRRMQQYKIPKPVSIVSTKEKYEIKGNSKKVAVIDFGLNKNILTSLKNRNLDIKVFPEKTTAEEILSGGFDGVLLTNGPGNPNDNTEIIKNIQKLFGKIPMFGICLGHQLILLSQGGSVSKLKCGHRGNYPVKNLKTNKMYITSQNHSYIVEEKDLPKNAETNFINWNDKTIEGIVYPNERCFSVQFHPESNTGPNDAGYLFDDFVILMTKEAK